jgi:hypothetical protein
MYAAVNDHPGVVHALVVAQADLNMKDTVRTTDTKTHSDIFPCYML